MIQRVYEEIANLAHQEVQEKMKHKPLRVSGQISVLLLVGAQCER